MRLWIKQRHLRYDTKSQSIKRQKKKKEINKN